MMEISKTYKFEAAHRLPHVPPGHQCGRMHGHSYKVRLVLRGQVDVVMGWVQDFGEISEVWHDHTDPWLDHHLLNDILGNPTAEALAQWIGKELAPDLPLLVRVEVFETEGSMAAWEAG